MWNKNERDGKIDQAKGRAKQAVGDLTGDEKLKAEGEMDEAGGKVEEAVGTTPAEDRGGNREDQRCREAVTWRGCHAAGGRRAGGSGACALPGATPPAAPSSMAAFSSAPTRIARPDAYSQSSTTMTPPMAPYVRW